MDNVLLVRDLTTVGVTSCSPRTLLTEVARVFLEKNLEAMVVLDQEDGHALGVISQDDLTRGYCKENRSLLCVEDVMYDDVPQIPPDIPLVAAIQIMLDRGGRALFLMHHSAGIEYPAAVLTYRHLIRHLAARNEDELRDLGIKAERKSPLETFIEKRTAAQRQARMRGSD